MATTPTPISREEFEAGEEFQLLDPLDGTFRLANDPILKRHIKKGNKGLYCMIYTVENDGFRFIQYVFGHQFIEKVYFKDCFVLK